MSCSERLDALGERNGLRLSTTDLTDQIAAAQAALDAARRRRERIQSIRGVAHEVKGHLELEHALEEAEGEVAAAQEALRSLRGRVGQSQVEVRLQAPPVVQIGETRLPFPWLGKLGLPSLLDTSAPRKRTLRLHEVYDGALSLEGGYTPDAARLDGASKFAAMAMWFRILGESDPVGPFGGLDLSLGGGGGFLYGLQLLGGAGLPLGKRFAVGVSTGPGIDGITSTIPFGVDFPIELYLSLDLFKAVGASIRVRDGWVFAAKARRHGSSVAPFGDEASAALTLGLASRDGGDYSQNRDGLAIGFGVRQALGATIYSLDLGFGAHESNFTERQ